MIIMHEANIADVKEGIIVHGCNAHGVMGSGVALSLKLKYPFILDAYKELCDTNHTDKNKLLGRYTLNVHRDIIIMNLITQVFYGYDGRRYASVDAIKDGLTVAAKMATVEDKTIHIPLIGCGRGGLSWEAEVKPIVERISEEWNIDINVYYIKE